MANQKEPVFRTNFKIGKRKLSENDCPSTDDENEYNTLYEPDYQPDESSPSQRNIQQQKILSQSPSDCNDSDSSQHFQIKPGSALLYSNQRSSMFDNLKRPREVAKNNGNDTAAKYKDSFPHLSDPSLPKELTEQFQPLYCKLCTIQLSSNVMAKLHYKSKNHEKKVRKYLTEYSERTGEPLHARAVVTGMKKQKTEEDKDPRNFHCDVCDLPLTGRLHAESHYMGKNHQRAVAGKTPAGKGNFNDEGKWVRRTAQLVLASGRDNVGTDFVSPNELTSINDLKERRLRCDICDVQVSSDYQMHLHTNGNRHKKRLHQEATVVEETVVPVIGDPENNILSAIACDNVLSGDLSVFRTPTGFYYCSPCNLSLNSETQFKQHLGSKRHRKKSILNKE